MTPKKLARDFYVAAQIDPSDMPAIAAMGIRTVLVNRPDGEETGQPDFELIKQSALQNGLRVCFLPVISGQRPQQHHALALKALLNEGAPPILAYCRSGTRSTFLWAMAQKEKGVMDQNAIIGAAAEAGYNVSPVFG